MKLVTGGSLTAASYVIWGLLPLYYSQLSGIDAFEIFSIRAIFAVPVIYFLWRLSGGKTEYKQWDYKSWGLVSISALCISASWYLNTWGVTHGQVLNVSLAYFLTPMLSIAVGVFFFREVFTPLQCIAVLACFFGFLYSCVDLSHFPWVTVGIALAFSGYGIIKKVLKTDMIGALLIESILVFPFGMAYMLWEWEDTVFSNMDPGINFMLFLTSPIALLPLAIFAIGVSRISNLTSVAILQYIEPTIYFVLGYFIFGEEINPDRLITFIVIWIGFILYSLDTFRRAKSVRDKSKNTCIE